MREKSDGLCFSHEVTVFAAEVLDLQQHVKLFYYGASFSKSQYSPSCWTAFANWSKSTGFLT